jgi:GH35 family endo-1,4-beta-xylanase
MPRDRQQLERRYRQRFQEIAARYAQEIPIWDGVNESLVCQDDFPLFSADERDYPSYVPWAFREQQQRFRPDNLLLINDVTSFNWPSSAANRYYLQCRRLLAEKVPIEGIGFQFHFFSRHALDGYLHGDLCDPHTLLDTYERFASFGLPLWITEITIGSAGEDGLAVQERVVRDLYRLWFSTSRMAGITWWNLGDGTAYGNEGVAGGGLTDETFQRKPAYQALDQLINHQWKTNLTQQSDANGNVHFRGFHGTYVVNVTAGDKARSVTLVIGSGAPAIKQIALP